MMSEESFEVEEPDYNARPQHQDRSL